MRRNAIDEAEDIAPTSMLPRAPKKYPMLATITEVCSDQKQ